MKRFEIKIWEKAEHWYFYATVEAEDEQHAKVVVQKEYPKRGYSIQDVRTA